MLRVPTRTIWLLDDVTSRLSGCSSSGLVQHTQKRGVERNEKMLPLDSVTSPRNWAEVHLITLKDTCKCWQKSAFCL